MLRRFAKDEKGSIGAIMMLGSLTMVGAISVSLDYSRMNGARSSLSAATDASALAAAQAPEANRQTIAREVFDANYRDSADLTSFEAISFKRGNDEVMSVKATASVKMTLSQAIGYSSAPVGATSEVVVGNDADLQIALVLDVTGSMSGTRLTDLKASASNMVNTLFSRLQRANQVKIAVVPFSEYVNIGMDNRNAGWVSNAADYTTTAESCGWVKVKSQTIWQCKDVVTEFKWSGCVGSRDYPLNVRDENYGNKAVPAVHNVNCTTAMLPLTAIKTNVLDRINGLAATGNTYIPAGAMWGWAALSPGEPFNEPTDPQRDTKRYLVLMTDGENTISPSYPYHNSGSVATANTLTAEVCANVKAAGIQVFSIAFQVTTSSVKTLLTNCASSSDRFFDATSATQLSDAFDAIARQMTNLRIAK
ncbi:MAG: pilus assembly protein TadG-related protein [Beijerinckiaceae bacterium]|nr:pilus assembly protein TadG-related protein [Beijerinckiaceae bacterium]